VSETLFREFTLKEAADGIVLVSFLRSNAKPFADNGTPLHVIVTNEELDRLDVQIAYYFGVTIKAIAEQVWVSGRKYSKESWHELFARQFLPEAEIDLPGGGTTLKRQSIARGKIGMKAMAKFTMEVEAHCASEFGVEFPENPNQR
jgi:hypothetical protein